MDGSQLLEALVAALIVAGAGFSLIGSLGLLRMPDFFTRLHGPSKATTIGIGSLLVASAIYFEAALVIAMLGFVGTVALAKYIVRGHIID
jgi:monovalent cation/proton antiporter MnhG/PhaG subunit